MRDVLGFATPHFAHAVEPEPHNELHGHNRRTTICGISLRCNPRGRGRRPLQPIGAFGAGIDLVRAAWIEERFADDTGVVSERSVVTITALAQHPCWQRHTDPVPA